jgi:hypothetical protein
MVTRGKTSLSSPPLDGDQRGKSSTTHTIKMSSIAGVLVIAVWCVQVFYSSAQVFSTTSRVEMYDSDEAIAKILQETVLSIQEPQVRVVRHPDNNTLNDKTIRWSRDVHRLWLGNHVKENHLPPAQILVTNFGWNHPNRTVGLNYSRTLRSTRLTEGVINHPWFHPTAWHDFENSNISQIDKSIRYYVFLDVETCFESNWPNYGTSGRERESNFDLMDNRASSRKGVDDNCSGLRHCGPIYRALKSRIFHTTGVNATLVVYDCKGNGQQEIVRRETKRFPISMVTISSERRQMSGLDQGLPPPAVNPVLLTARQRQDIEECRENSRPNLIVFAGNLRDKVRQALGNLHDEKKGVIIIHRNQLAKYLNGTTFGQLLAGSKFAACPRGDNRFSYRFTEILSAGAIPVVHSDGWVLPFREELVDWKECALHIPEKDANRTLEILSQIDDKKRCQMRKRCYEIYQKYMRTTEGTVAGIIEGLELASGSLYDVGHGNNRTNGYYMT